MNYALEQLYKQYEEHLNLKKTQSDFSNGYYLNTKDTNYKTGGIILYGQEPNGWAETFDSYPEGINDIINNRKNTLFCQKIQKVWEQNGLINNIAKFSKKENGKYPPVNPKDCFWNRMYASFKYNETDGTIYQHELNILKPTKILLLCGPGRKQAIECAFGFEKGIPDNWIPHLNTEDCVKIFKSEEYKDITFMYTLHPQAHMSAEIRQKYDNEIKEFLKL